jgi:ribosome recycling factor
VREVSDISAADILRVAGGKMDKSIDHLRHELSTIRTGRANPSLIEHVNVDYYGTATPLNQLCQISVPEARMLLVQPYDRSQIAAMERAIRDSGLGLNPANDGQVIRVPIPTLTEERRKEYVRLVRQRAEDGRVAIRNIRRDELQRVHQQEKAGDLPADEARRVGDQLQKLTDVHVGTVDAIASEKESEVMAV